MTLVLLTLFSRCLSAAEPFQSDSAIDLEQYVTVRLTSDLGGLSDKQRQMIPLLIKAAQLMDGIFWQQAYGDRDQLLTGLSGRNRAMAKINYGPWDRLANNKPLWPGVAAKPAGANFYPHDMTKDEFIGHLQENPDDGRAFKSLYTVIERDGNRGLVAVPYHQRFEQPTKEAAGLLRAAAKLAEDEGFRRYLLARAEALLNDDYQASDFAWLDMKDNALDIVIGPIETYEDQLFGYKAAHEAYVLLKDQEWSQRLTKYAAVLPALQRGLPVDSQYKQERPGSDAQLNAYDVIYYAGDCNAGSKTIAINLPNDEHVQLTKGTRRLQLKNAMRAKFDRILVPIANSLIVEDQRQHITFDAFFGNTMFHEVAHGLGIKSTINGRGRVREALREHASTLEEGKADVLGLYMVTQLFEQGELTEGSLMDNYVTFVASIFRSVRFGASSAHGRANTLRFNYFEQLGAFSRTEGGQYRVHPDKMREAVNRLSGVILKLQGDGDYDGARAIMDKMGSIRPTLQQDLDRLQEQGIPVDVVFEQGLEVLGL
jgi:hypothetical protein